MVKFISQKQGQEPPKRMRIDHGVGGKTILQLQASQTANGGRPGWKPLQRVCCAFFFLLMPGGSFDRLELALAVLAVAGPC